MFSPWLSLATENSSPQSLAARDRNPYCKKTADASRMLSHLNAFYAASWDYTAIMIHRFLKETSTTAPVSPGASSLEVHNGKSDMHIPCIHDDIRSIHLALSATTPQWSCSCKGMFKHDLTSESGNCTALARNHQRSY